MSFLARLGRRLRGLPDHHVQFGKLVCLNADGAALDINHPDPWDYCPYCGDPIASSRLAWKRRAASAGWAAALILSSVAFGGLLTVEVAEHAVNNVGDEAFGFILQVNAFTIGQEFGRCDALHGDNATAYSACIDNSTAALYDEYHNWTVSP